MPIFLKYGDIKGEVTEPAHPSWIELTSVQLGTGRRVHPSENIREPPSPTLSEITVTKNSDSASVALFRESLSGQGVPATIDFVRDDGSAYLRLEMSGTLIASYSLGKGDPPVESLTFNFSKVEYKFTPGTPP